MKLNELKTSTVKSYLDKTVDPVYGMPKSKEKLPQRTKGIERASKRVTGEKPTSEDLKSDNPCWKGYKPVGTKKKGGKTVPNCVPKESMAEEKQKGVDGKACWDGYKRMGTKKKGGKTVDNCVPMEEAGSAAQQAAIAISMKKAGKKPKNESMRDGEYITAHVTLDNGDVKEVALDSDENISSRIKKHFAKHGHEVVDIKINWGIQGHQRDTYSDPQGDAQERRDRESRALSRGPIEGPRHRFKEDNELNEDWQKVNKSDKTDGMSSKAVKAYRRENPGSKLKTAVTTKPSKLKKGSKSAKRRKSFCARMSGMKKAHASAKTKRDPDSPINKALRRWNCESIENLENQLTEIKLNENKRSRFE